MMLMFQLLYPIKDFVKYCKRLILISSACPLLNIPQVVEEWARSYKN